MFTQASTRAAVTNPSPVTRPPEARISFAEFCARTSATTANTTGQDTNESAPNTSASTAGIEVVGLGVTRAGPEFPSSDHRDGGCSLMPGV